MDRYEIIKDLLPSLVSLAAVIVSGLAIKGSRKTELTSTYFDKKVESYAAYLACVANFVYHPCDSTRDNLAISYYSVGLFAGDAVLSHASVVYMAVMDWSRAGGGSALILDELVNTLREEMRQDLASFDRRP